MANSFDVFISYNHEDKRLAQSVADALIDRGLTVWMDDTALPPGKRWRPEVEDALRTASAVVVLVGPHGFGPEMEREVDIALSNQARREYPVIPVAMPGKPQDVRIPGFLATNTWITLPTIEDTDALERLCAGISQRPLPARKPRRQREEAQEARHDPCERAARYFADRFRTSQITFYVGKGLYCSQRTHPPGNACLSRELLTELKFIDEEYGGWLPTPEVTITLYAMVEGGDRNVETRTVEIIERRSVEIPPGYQKLARLLRRLASGSNVADRNHRRHSFRKQYSLVVTTNLDVLLERAFLAEGLSFTRIVQCRDNVDLDSDDSTADRGEERANARDGGARGSVVKVNRYRVNNLVGQEAVEVEDGSGRSTVLALNDTAAVYDLIEQAPAESIPASQLSFSDIRGPILYKPYGSQEFVESYVLTAAQYLEFARRCSRSKFIPTEIKLVIQSTPGLFLGYHPLDPDLRLLYHGVLRSRFTDERERRYGTLEPPVETRANQPHDRYRDVEVHDLVAFTEAVKEQMKITLLRTSTEDFLDLMEREFENRGELGL